MYLSTKHREKSIISIWNFNLDTKLRISLEVDMFQNFPMDLVSRWERIQGQLHVKRSEGYHVTRKWYSYRLPIYEYYSNRNVQRIFNSVEQNIRKMTRSILGDDMLESLSWIQRLCFFRWGSWIFHTKICPTCRTPYRVYVTRHYFQDLPSK